MESDAKQTPHALRPNYFGNVGLFLYMTTLLCIGLFLVGFAWRNESSAWLYGVGGLFVLMGGGMLFSRMRGGVALVRFDCPACQHAQSYSNRKAGEGLIFPCRGCAQYLTARDGRAVTVALDHRHQTPVFEAPLPSAGTYAWSGGCMLCGSPHVQAEEVEGVSLVRRGSRSIVVKRSLSIPVCAEHALTSAVELRGADYIGGLEHFALRFRDHATALRFRRENPMPLDVRNALTFDEG